MFLLRAYVVLCFLIVGVLAVFTSPLMALGALMGCVFLGLAILHPLSILGFLALYFPLEPFLMKFVPDELFVLIRFAPEVLLYLIVGIAIAHHIARRRAIPPSPINLPFVLFLATLFASTIINLVEPSVALVGIRQIVRFMLVFFAVLFLCPSKQFIRQLTIFLLFLVGLEAVLGVSQFVIGEPLDAFLFPSEGRFLGEITLAPNAFHFWDPGSRVFATLGRYDRLGTFLAFFLLLAIGALYEIKKPTLSRDVLILILVGLPALALTYSRSGWFGFLMGFLVMAWWLKRDRRVRVAALSFAIIIGGYLALSGLAVRSLVDTPAQPIAERFFEAFSYERWAGEYYGVGRLFWIVNTPLHVIPTAPLFGHGPGQFGGGAVSALRNTRVYDELRLPFGIAGTEGYVDNNWLSIWGETGTIGLVLYLWMLGALLHYALRVWREAKDPAVRALALGFVGALCAFGINAFLASFLETRTLAYYFWLYAGFVVVLGQKEGVKIPAPFSRSL